MSKRLDIVNPAPSAVFFDLDGTMLDWQAGMEESWLAACEAHFHGLFVPAKRALFVTAPKETADVQC